ncbi:ABC transporter substrate-binding protein [Paracoccus aminovorans]|uniref:ABC transporter substrate-binding protein n=1 Tax=Paracoccus aminovorans TaxID=34004 RepID=UPI0007864026|nr:ABC transporter substrate-binding protein [Paracoccus aminovorans]
MTLRSLFGAVAICGLAAGMAQATDYPLSIENCGQPLVFDSAPERVVTIGQSTTEMLYALGLGEQVQGTSVWFNDVLPEFAEVNAKIERLADNHPGFESVMAKEPQLVTTQFEFHVGPQGAVGTRAQFNELGAQVYAMPADCVGKDNLVGGDGARTSEFSIESMYRAVRELAQIFDVEERGAVLEAELRGRVDAAVAKAGGLGAEGKTAVVWFSSPDLALDPFVAGQNGIAGYVLKTIGLRNVVESDEEWPSVGWETIASADPDYIIIARMDRRRFAADDYEVKLDYLKTDPVTSRMAAVRDGRIIIVDAHQIHAGIRIPSGIETVVAGIEAGGAQE